MLHTVPSLTDNYIWILILTLWISGGPTQARSQAGVEFSCPIGDFPEMLIVGRLGVLRAISRKRREPYQHSPRRDVASHHVTPLHLRKRPRVKRHENNCPPRRGRHLNWEPLPKPGTWSLWVLLVLESKVAVPSFEVFHTPYLITSINIRYRVSWSISHDRRVVRFRC